MLPTRDRPALLAEAIQSVLVQTYPCWELIIVDDGSDQAAIVPDDPRIRLIRLDPSGGPARARNRGIAAAGGDFIAFLDDDDLYAPHRLHTVATTGTCTDPVVVCWSRYLNETPRHGRMLTGDVSLTILGGPTPSLGATAVRRDVCPLFDERLLGIEDVEWWMRLADVATVRTIAHVGHIVRPHGGPRHLNTVRRRIEENTMLLEQRSRYFSERPSAAAHRWKRIGLMAEASDDMPLARTAYRRSAAIVPSMSIAGHLVRSHAPRPMRAPLRRLSRLRARTRPVVIGHRPPPFGPSSDRRSTAAHE